jgi:hypothetical protein
MSGYPGGPYPQDPRGSQYDRRRSQRGPRYDAQQNQYPAQPYDPRYPAQPPEYEDEEQGSYYLEPVRRGRIRRALQASGLAYIRFLSDPLESTTLKVLPLVVTGVVPVEEADDLLIPIIGQLDGYGLMVVALVGSWKTYKAVRRHR